LTCKEISFLLEALEKYKVETYEWYKNRSPLQKLYSRLVEMLGYRFSTLARARCRISQTVRLRSFTVRPQPLETHNT
jgi:hypothetical protein